MPPDRTGVLLEQVRKALAAEAAGGLTDRELLRRFTGRHDGEAFAALVRRHGPMVLGVARRVLHDAHASEDVFQAVFLVLARKAPSLRWHESAANWLCTVAYHLARKAKAAAARRHRHECHAPDRPSEDPLGEIKVREARAVLDEELARLPENYRVPLVLCYLEGMTRDEAAQQLGWSLGTLKRRLEQGRRRLRDRLTRRGLAPAAALLTTAVAGGLAPAMPPALATAATRAALLVAAGRALEEVGASASAAALARGLLDGTAAARVKAAIAVALVVGVLTAGAGVAAYGPMSGEPPAPQGNNDPPPAARDEPNPAADVPARQDLHGDPLPPGALARMGSDRFRHGGQVCAFAFSPDGKTLASASYQGRVCFWDAATGRRLRQFQAPKPKLYALAFSADGKELLTLGQDDEAGGSVGVWDAATGKRPRRF